MKEGRLVLDNDGDCNKDSKRECKREKRVSESGSVVLLTIYRRLVTLRFGQYSLMITQSKMRIPTKLDVMGSKKGVENVREWH